LTTPGYTEESGKGCRRGAGNTGYAVFGGDVPRRQLLGGDEDVDRVPDPDGGGAEALGGSKQNAQQ